MTDTSGHTNLIFGPPGTGKTTTTSNIVGATARARGAEKVMVCSFTRTAALELRGRGLPIPEKQVGTLHSMAFRRIDKPVAFQGALIKDWNEKHPQWAMKPNGGTGPIEESPAEWVGEGEGTKMIGEIEILRNRLIDPENWPKASLVRFHEEWTKWKAELGAVDFTDMIEMAIAETTAAPGEPEVMFMDEAQDATPLELKLFRHWGAQADRVVLVGDDDQCAPGDQMVMLADGSYKRIDAIEPGVDRLASWEAGGGRQVRGGALDRWGNPGKGYDFQRAVRNYSGPMVRFMTAETTAEFTADHRVCARWSERAASPDARCVYLMRKGNWWRIGKVQLLKSGRFFGPSMRCRQEGADAIWLLGCYDSNPEALIAEQWFAAQYGISKAMWRGDRQNQVTEEMLFSLHDRLASGGSGDRALRLMSDLGLDPRFPFWEVGDHTGKAGKAWQKIRACNVPSGWMDVPVWGAPGGISEESRVPRLLPVTTERYEAVDIPVYSLNVEPYHTYIAAGQITWQCLYRFRGSSPDAMLDVDVPDENRRVLDQSYRVPAAVLDVADRWVKTLSRRADKVYRPRAERTNEQGVKLDDHGKVTRSHSNFSNGDDLVREIRERLDAGRSVMCIAACSYMLEPVKQALRSEGIPFHNPYRPSRVDWNPMRPGTHGRTSATERLAAYLVMDQDAYGDASRLWTGGDVKAWSKFVKSNGVFRRGAKGAIEGLPNRELSYEEVAALFTNEDELTKAVEPSLDWFAAHLTAEGAKALEYPIQVYRKHGPAGLAAEPQVTLGTIHSAKGGQSDSVFLAPDLSLAGMREWESVGEARDATIRQFYVAMTRAAEELVICEAKTNLSLDFTPLLA